MAALRRRLGEAGAPLKPRIDSELANHLDYVDCALQGCKWSVGDTLSDARQKAYDAVTCIRFTGMQYRKDIGDKALRASGTTVAALSAEA